MNRRLAPVTSYRPCLSRGCCQCEALYADGSVAIGFTTEHPRACFHAHAALFHQPFPENVGTHPRSFSHEADSSSEFLRLQPPPSPFGNSNTCQGFCPLRDITAGRPQPRGFLNPRSVPSSGDHSLSTVCSALQLVSLFHPTAAFRTLARSGVWPLHAGFDLVGRSCPLVVGARFAHRRIDGHDPSPSTSRLCSTRSRDPLVRWLSLASDRSPHRVFCSSRRSPDHCPRFTRRQTLMTLTQPNEKPRKTRSLTRTSSPSAPWRPGVWPSHPERRDCRPARAFEPSQNSLLSRECLGPETFSTLLRGAEHIRFQNLQHVSSKSPQHLQPSRTFHASASRASTPTNPKI
jgi:hypothetical protein